MTHEHVRKSSHSINTAYCIWSVIQSNPPISSSWVTCHSSWVICYSLLHVKCHSIKSSNLEFVSHMSQFVSHMLQPIACEVSFNQILQSRVRESHVTVRESYVTAYCMWSVIQSNPPISSSWVTCHSSWVICYSLLHFECHSIESSNLNRIGLFSPERGKRDLEN